MIVELHTFDSEAPQRRILHVQGGAEPYLWIGGDPGHCYGVTATEDDLVAVRDAITRVLSEARPMRRREPADA